MLTTQTVPAVQSEFLLQVPDEQAVDKAAARSKDPATAQHFMF